MQNNDTMAQLFGRKPGLSGAKPTAPAFKPQLRTFQQPQQEQKAAVVAPNLNPVFRPYVPPQQQAKPALNLNPVFKPYVPPQQAKPTAGIAPNLNPVFSPFVPPQPQTKQTATVSNCSTIDNSNDTYWEYFKSTLEEVSHMGPLPKKHHAFRPVNDATVCYRVLEKVDRFKETNQFRTSFQEAQTKLEKVNTNEYVSMYIPAIDEYQEMEFCFNVKEVQAFIKENTKDGKCPMFGREYLLLMIDNPYIIVEEEMPREFRFVFENFNLLPAGDRTSKPDSLLHAIATVVSNFIADKSKKTASMSVGFFYKIVQKSATFLWKAIDLMRNPLWASIILNVARVIRIVLCIYFSFNNAFEIAKNICKMLIRKLRLPMLVYRLIDGLLDVALEYVKCVLLFGTFGCNFGTAISGTFGIVQTVAEILAFGGMAILSACGFSYFTGVPTLLSDPTTALKGLLQLDKQATQLYTIAQVIQNFNFGSFANLAVMLFIDFISSGHTVTFLKFIKTMLPIQFQMCIDEKLETDTFKNIKYVSQFFFIAARSVNNMLLVYNCLEELYLWIFDLAPCVISYFTKWVQNFFTSLVFSSAPVKAEHILSTNSSIRTNFTSGTLPNAANNPFAPPHTTASVPFVVDTNRTLVGQDAQTSIGTTIVSQQQLQLQKEKNPGLVTEANIDNMDGACCLKSVIQNLTSLLGSAEKQRNLALEANDINRYMEEARQNQSIFERFTGKPVGFESNLKKNIDEQTLLQENVQALGFDFDYTKDARYGQNVAAATHTMQAQQSHQQQRKKATSVRVIYCATNKNLTKEPIVECNEIPFFICQGPPPQRDWCLAPSLEHMKSSYPDAVWRFRNKDFILLHRLPTSFVMQLQTMESPIMRLKRN